MKLLDVPSLPNDLIQGKLAVVGRKFRNTARVALSSVITGRSHMDATNDWPAEVLLQVSKEMTVGPLMHEDLIAEWFQIGLTDVVILQVWAPPLRRRPKIISPTSRSIARTLSGRVSASFPSY